MPSQLNQTRKRLAVLVSVAILSSGLGLSHSVASRGGVVVKSNPFVVGMTFRNEGIDGVCSGVLISPTFIATAAHCVVGSKGNLNTDFVFTPPATSLDAPINPRIVAPKILNIYKPVSYTTSMSSNLDDIAFIQLDKALGTQGMIRIATNDELASLRSGKELFAYGFGYVYETKAPYSPWPRKYPLVWRQNLENGSLNKTLDLTSTKASACSGDSGGPITTILNSGEEVLVGVLSGAALVQESCGQNKIDGQFHMLITLASPYLNLISSVFQTSLGKKPTPTPSRLIKITCVKGKIKKVISGTNPKCPKGYVRKK